MQTKIFIVLVALVCVAYCQREDSHRERPGQCVPQINQQRCRNECRRDSDCRGSVNKCCATTCGGSVCNAPMTTTTTTRRPQYTVPPKDSSSKPGTCPGPLAQFSCAAECQRDGDCRSNQKCCPTTCGGAMCKPPATSTTTTTTTTTRPPPGSRPGQCPNVSPRSIGRQDPSCRDKCNRDRDCRQNGYKCCNNSCGAKECMAPEDN